MPHDLSNKQVSRLLNEVVAAYEVKEADRFRISAYRRAADAIEHLTTSVLDLWEKGTLEDIPGVGESIAGHLDELFRTGRVSHFIRVKKGLPEGMFALLEVPNVGPKTAYKLASKLGVSTPRELKLVCESGKIAELEGFGEESQAKILRGLVELERRTGRMLLPFARQVADKYTDYLNKHRSVLQALPLGSLRRMKETVGDIDIAVSTEDSSEVVKQFVAYPDVSKVVSQGDKKATVVLKNGTQVDLMTQKPRAFGSLLQHFTGSKQHNIHLRVIAKDRGLSLSEYGITKMVGDKRQKARGKRREFVDEESFYAFLGMDWIPPELREDTGEIAAATRGELPKLIELKNIKGDLQMHTPWSDGANSLEEMVKEGIKLGYEYLGISDHAPSIRVHGESKVAKMIEDRCREFDRVQKKYPQIKVLFGIECDITAEARMALPDGLLQRFDYVIASIHTGFAHSREKITKRLLAALANPFVSFIAHPTGRLLEERQGYEADWEQVFKACVKNNKWLEINAHPHRLDLPDTLARRAKEAGVILTINTDAHSVSGLTAMPYGVAVARRGWVEARDVVNTRTFSELMKLIDKTKGKR